METGVALALAQRKGLDLVEVAPNADPPVCRLLNYGKYRYTLRKKEKEAAKKQRIIRLKEVKIRPKIDEHDYLTKLRMIWNFLAHGDKVKLTLAFRGREMSHQELGHQLVQRVVEDLKEIADPESAPKQEGSQIVVHFNPKPGKPVETLSEG